MPSISVVIPAYNEVRTIRDIATRARAQCDRVVVVDDGSSDGTSACLHDLDITVIRHERNMRKAGAICTGMRAALDAGADTIVTLDADGQHRPEDIPALIAAAEMNPDDIIIGARSHQSDPIPFSRSIANKIANFWISWAAGYRLSDSQSGFRLYPSNLLSQLDFGNYERGGFVFESEILIDAARKCIESVSITIPAIYSPDARPSHFRGAADISAITLMVAGKLLRRGLYLPGLYRSFFRPHLRRYAPPGFDRDATWALVLSLLAFIPTLGIPYLWLLYKVHRTAFTAPSDIDHSDSVIILGHRLVRGHLSEDFERRLDRAVRLYKKHEGVALVIVGGRRDSGMTEAEVGAEYLVRHGVRSSNIVKENLSSNTVENLSRARVWFVPGHGVALVSNRYHLERILTISEGMNLAVIPCAAEGRYFFKKVFGRSIIEAFYLHWYWAGRLLGQLTNNPRILNKIGVDIL